MRSKLNTKKLFMGLVISTFLIMLILNNLTPLLADDYVYLYKTKNWFTILADEYNQYVTWTGRSVVHVIARIFLLLPKGIFNVFNALAYTIVTYLVYRLTLQKQGEKYNSFRFIIIQVLFWLFIPAFGEVFLWETGSANYLWGSLIILSFLYVYHREIIEEHVFTKTKLMIFLMFALGILAGWCNENTSGGALLIVLGYLGWQFYTKRKLSLWMFTGVVGNIIGLALMVLAPGNKVRATYFARSTWSLPRKAMTGIITIFEQMKENLSLFLVILILLLVLYAYISQDKKRVYLSVVYFISGIATMLVLIISPTALTYGRSYYGAVLFLIIAFSMSLPNYKVNIRFSPIYSVLYVILACAFFMNVMAGVSDVILSKLNLTKQYSYLVEQEKKGNLNPVFPNVSYTNTTKYSAYSNHLLHVTIHPEENVNRSVAKYYGLESVRSVSEKDWNNIYRNGNPELMNIFNLNDYLQKLTNTQYTVLLSGYGNQIYLSKAEKSLLEELGVDVNLEGSKAWTLSAVVSKNDKRVEKNPELSRLSGKIEALNYDVFSSYTNYENQTFASVKINDTEMSRNKKGLNFVIIDNNTNKVIDSVNFDITEKNAPGMR
ncbi:DUF3329 domain-containing protein [Enterococcus faecalis]|uniref:DUF3329 domain-containing protein n=2 Tax=Enterococcus faecalis TaxID=1351 RepID=UPI00177FCFF9|nr:DUF6056 family protein [Enterococcus faecalis]EHB6450818.1 hypothetical protein [Enterococcus faecalis]MCO5488868.1 DUF3329 domain-containing protein [Enterococcus faecalis]MDT2102142.1 DUF6056 family protein [Enterococcus faecalis]QOG34160.1 hypothetical protein EGM183_08485 [Enterococcus faecalis]HDV0788806.1 DUF3329 domain-containing protein [Enterococcus faecalis]